MIILAVDDDIDDLEFFQDVLSHIDSSIHCIVKQDCSEALDFLNECIPDIIFLDINMPKMTGIECLSRIAKTEHLKDVPVILFSTAFNPNFDDLLLRPYTKFVTKKSTFKESVEVVRLVLDQHNLLSVG